MVTNVRKKKKSSVSSGETTCDIRGKFPPVGAGTGGEGAPHRPDPPATVNKMQKKQSRREGLKVSSPEHFRKRGTDGNWRQRKKDGGGGSLCPNEGVRGQGEKRQGPSNRKNQRNPVKNTWWKGH